MGPEAVAVGTRRATTARWVASTLVMQEGEQGLDTDTGEVKYGDGVHTWSALPLFGDADGGNGGGGGAPAARVDHGPIADTLTITQPGSHELDLTVNATVTVTTPDDVTLWVHGTGQTLTVAGQTFTVTDDAVILAVTSPRDVQSSYLVGGDPGAVDPGDGGSTPDWSVIITDDFTGADAALLTGRTTTTGGRTWSALGSEDSLSIKSNQATQAAAAYNPYSELYLAAPLSVLALEVDYLAAQQTDSSLPNLGIRLANMPGVRIESDGGSGWRLLVVGYNAENSFGTIAGPEAIPASGTLRVQRVDGDLTITVDGEEVLTLDPTGYSGYGAASDYVQLSMSSGKSSTFDNISVEVPA